MGDGEVEVLQVFRVIVQEGEALRLKTDADHRSTQSTQAVVSVRMKETAFIRHYESFALYIGREKAYIITQVGPSTTTSAFLFIALPVQ